MHEGEGSAWEVYKDNRLRSSENPGSKKQRRINGHDPNWCRTTPRIFSEPLPFRNNHGCVGLRDKGSIPVTRVIMLMTLYCVAQEERRLNRN